MMLRSVGKVVAPEMPDAASVSAAALIVPACACGLGTDLARSAQMTNPAQAIATDIDLLFRRWMRQALRRKFWLGRFMLQWRGLGQRC